MDEEASPIVRAGHNDLYDRNNMLSEWRKYGKSS